MNQDGSSKRSPRNHFSIHHYHPSPHISNIDNNTPIQSHSKLKSLHTPTISKLNAVTSTMSIGSNENSAIGINSTKPGTTIITQATDTKTHQLFLHTSQLQSKLERFFSSQHQAEDKEKKIILANERLQSQVIHLEQEKRAIQASLDEAEYKCQSLQQRYDDLANLQDEYIQFVESNLLQITGDEHDGNTTSSYGEGSSRGSQTHHDGTTSKGEGANGHGRENGNNTGKSTLQQFLKSQQLFGFQREVEYIKQELVSKQQRVLQLEKINDELEVLRNELMDEIEQYKEKQQHDMIVIAEYDKLIASLKEQLQIFSSLCETIQDRLREVTLTNITSMNQSDDLHKKIERLEQVISQQNEKIRQCEEKNLHATAQIRSLEKENSELKRFNESLLVKMELAGNDKQKLLVHIHTLSKTDYLLKLLTNDTTGGLIDEKPCLEGDQGMDRGENLSLRRIPSQNKTDGDDAPGHDPSHLGIDHMGDDDNGNNNTHE